MTNEEFENYLLTVNLVCPYHNTEIKNRGFFEIPDEWLTLTKDCIEELLINGWDGFLCQCKEKYGEFRFYTIGMNDLQYNILEKYANLIDNLELNFKK